jgi:hypothetical protein
LRTNSRVAISGGAALECGVTNRRVVGAGCVGRKSLNATGSILVARGIARERPETVRCVFDPVGVAAERVDASSRVDVACRVAQKGRHTNGRVASAYGIA